MVLLIIIFCTAPLCSKHFVLGLFVRSLSTQLFFLVVLLLLLLSMIAFSYVGLLSSECDFFTLPEPSSNQLFSWGVVFWAVCRARIPSLVSFFSSGLFFGIPIFRVFVLSSLQGHFRILFFWGGGGEGGVGGGVGVFLFLSLFSDSVDFSYSEGWLFLFL